MKQERNVRFGGIYLVFDTLNERNVESHEYMENAVRAALILTNHDRSVGVQDANYEVKVIGASELNKISKEGE